MRTSPRFAAALLGLALLAAGAATAHAQTDAELFDPSVLHDLRLWINTRDLAALREQAATNTYYPADLEWRGIRVRSVGIRSRGNGSRNATKLGLRVDFNRYVSGQQFLGLRSVVLDNLWQDPSMVREHVAMALFAQLGQPSSRESFARLFINDEYQGVYSLVEPVDARYLTRTLGDQAGYLFEYRWLQPYYFEDLGDDLTAYVQLFEAENHPNDPLALAYGPIREMVRAINEPSDTRWKAEADRYVDLQQFVTVAAIEAFMAEWDGLTGYAGLNNFYLYRRGGSDRHVFIPWDRDHAFHDLRTSVFERVGENLLLRRALRRSRTAPALPGRVGTVRAHGGARRVAGSRRPAHVVADPRRGLAGSPEAVQRRRPRRGRGRPDGVRALAAAAGPDRGGTGRRRHQVTAVTCW